MFVKLVKIALGIAACAALGVSAAMYATAPLPFAADTESGRRLASGPFATALAEAEWVDTARATAANRDYAGAPDRRFPVAIWYPVAAPGRHPLLIYKGSCSIQFYVRRQRDIHRKPIFKARSFLARHIVAHHQIIQPRSQEGHDAVFDAIYYRLDVVVERRVEQDADSGDLLERVYQLPVPGICFL